MNATMLLIIYALRVGAVDSPSFDHLVARARARRDEKVIWKHPKWPLSPQTKSLASGLVPSTPLNYDSVHNSAKDALVYAKKHARSTVLVTIVELRRQSI